MKKRICLFAGFNKNNIIADYVVFYIAELSKMADVYFLTDNELCESEIVKLDKITKGAWAYPHGKYDFGSWSDLIQKVGIEKIKKYDELILVNDSAFGPIFPFDEMVGKMDTLDFDVWGVMGLARINFIHSYFMVFNKKVILSNVLFDFMKNVKQENSYREILIKYEVGLSQLLFDSGFKLGCYNVLPSSYINIKKERIPLMKVKLWTQYKTWYFNLNHKSFIKNKTSYNYDLVESHLNQIGAESKLTDSIKLFFVSLYKKILIFIYEKRIQYNKKRFMIRIFGITVWIGKIK